jgi:hypothetical protein
VKAIPCDNCRGPAKLRDGSNYYLSACPSRRGSYTFVCAGCKRIVSLAPIEFNRLPDAGQVTYNQSERFA